MLNSRINMGLYIVLIAAFTVALFNYKKLIVSRNWGNANGTIIVSTVKEQKIQKNNRVTVEYEVIIKYKYIVDNIEYVSQNIMPFKGSIFDNISLAKELIERFPVDSVVTVYYDPKNPKDSCLINTDELPKKNLIAVFVLLLIATSMVIGAIIIVNKLKNATY